MKRKRRGRAGGVDDGGEPAAGGEVVEGAGEPSGDDDLERDLADIVEGSQSGDDHNDHGPYFEDDADAVSNPDDNIPGSGDDGNNTSDDARGDIGEDGLGEELTDDEHKNSDGDSGSDDISVVHPMPDHPLTDASPDAVDVITKHMR